MSDVPGLTPEQEAVRQQLLAGVRLVNGKPVADQDALAARSRARPKVESALKLAERGFKVFPVAAGQKAPPLLKDWPAKATTNADTIRAWWGTMDANANPAVHCEGFLVVDVDVKKDGEGSLAVVRANNELPQTLMVRTPSNGQHLFYRLPAGHPGVPNGVDVLGPGLDIRSTNGYVVGAGATTEAGRYRIEQDRPIAEAPAWLVAQLGAAAPAARHQIKDVPDAPDALVERAREWLTTAERSVKGSGGDQAAFRVAARLRDMGVSYEQACELMRSEAWDHGCGWRDGHLEEKPIRSAYRYAKNDPGSAAALPTDFPEVAPQPKADPVADFASMVEAHAAAPAEAPAAPAPSRGRGPMRLTDFASGGNINGGYLVKGLLQRASYALAYGTPGSGKTFVACDIGYHVAAGREWHGRKVHQGPVLYLAFEGAGGLRARAAAIREHYGREDVPLYFDDTAYNLRDKAGRAALGATIAALPQKPVLIVIDTLAHALCGGDENSAQDVGAFNAGVQALIAHTGANVLVIHHPGKAGNGARGSSALLGAVDTEIEIGSGAIKPTKQRDIEIGEPIGFTLKPIAVGWDEDDDIVTSCVVMPATVGKVPEGAEKLKPGSHPYLAYEILKEIRPTNDPVTQGEWRAKCSDFVKTPAAWRMVLLRLRRARLVEESPEGTWTRRLE